MTTKKFEIGYIYNVTTNSIAEIIKGEDKEQIEKEAHSYRYLKTDDHSFTYDKKGLNKPSNAGYTDLT